MQQTPISPSPPSPATTRQPVPPGQSMAQLAARVVWSLALLLVCLFTAMTLLDLVAATGAPQQAAAAAQGCFFVIAAYVFARAFEEVFNGRR